MIEYILLQILYFLLWTLLLYFIHILAHKVPFLWHFHRDHHKQVAMNNVGKWRWHNLFLYIDTFETTVDQWITEVIPTFVFSFITGAWWIFIGYYIWSATFQEVVEHNEKIDIYPYEVSGKWHMVHHTNPDKNYGIIIPIWDIIFNTFKMHRR